MQKEHAIHLLGAPEKRKDTLDIILKISDCLSRIKEERDLITEYLDDLCKLAPMKKPFARSLSDYLISEDKSLDDKISELETIKILLEEVNNFKKNKSVTVDVSTLTLDIKSQKENDSFSLD